MSRSDSPDLRQRARRVRGASLALLVIACVAAAGCGSGSGDAGKHAATQSATTAAVRAAHGGGKPADPLAKLAAHAQTKRQRELVAKLEHNALPPGSHPHSLTRSQVIAAALAANAHAAAHPANPADRTCHVSVAGRSVPVACGLRSQLLTAARRNKVLAGLLARAVPQH